MIGRRDFLRGLVALPAATMLADADMLDLYMQGVLPGLGRRRKVETNLQISQGGDDGHWASPDIFGTWPSSLLLGIDFSSNLYKSFYLFRGIDIPKSHHIINAYLRVTSFLSAAGDCYIGVYGTDADNADPPTSYAEAEGLALTAGVGWAIGSDWVAGTEYSSPDIASIIQGIVDRPGWTAGNNMMLVVGEYPTLTPPYGSRYIRSYDHDPGPGARLVITSKWAGKINGITPSKINGIPVENIRRVNGI